jgi:hypothetical protein
MEQLKLVPAGRLLRIRSFRDDRGHSTAWPLLRNEIPQGAAMIALRGLVRAQETRLWKETGGAAGTCSSLRAGRETDERLHDGFQPTELELMYDSMIR